MAKNVLTHNLSEPLGSVTTAKVEINAGDGNLTIDQLTGGEQVLASGTLQYLEKQGIPTRSVNTINGQATFTLKASGNGQSWFRFPWAACNGATEWQIHLNPTVQSDITAHSDGGNVNAQPRRYGRHPRLEPDTGGGNMDMVLPDNAANLSVTAKTGTGNVVVAHPRRRFGSNSRYHRTVQSDRGPTVQQE